MSPMPTPQYEQHLQDLLRRRNREGHPARNRDRAGKPARLRRDLPDPRLLGPSELQLEVMRAHRNWALRFHPHLLEEWLDGD